MTENQHHESTPAPSAGSVRPARRKRRVSVGLGLSAGVLALALGGGGLWYFSPDGPGSTKAEAKSTFSGSTEKIIQGDLEGSVSAAGTLKYAQSRKIQSGKEGTVTWLPAPGWVLKAGSRLYEVDTVPVFLMKGKTPAWRDFAAGMSDGADVKQLEENLRDMGFFYGEPDEHFDWYTIEALLAWQKAESLPASQHLDLGSVTFADADLRVGSTVLNVGDKVSGGAELLTVSSTTQVVTANLRLTDQQLAAVGGAVTIRLPGAINSAGKIASVGTPTELDGPGGQKQTVIPIVITVLDAKAAARFQEADVTVRLPSQKRRNVLNVPVDALLALDSTRFGVEVLDASGKTRQVPVTVGLFAAGRVEISGPDIKAGQNVVVPQR